MDARNAVALLSVLSLALLGQRVGTGGFAGGDAPTGLLPPQAGVAAAEHQDDIDASCTGWSFGLGESAGVLSCDTQAAALSISTSGTTSEGIAEVSDPEMPTNMAANSCQIMLVNEDAAGDLGSSRIGFPFGGDPTDQAAGVPMLYLDYAFGSGEPTVQSKWWDGDSWEPPTTEGLCDPGTGGGFLTTGEYLVACIDGTWGSGAQVQLWSFASNPCEGSCASSDLGTPEVTIDEVDCATVPLTTDGAAAGVYGLGDGSMKVLADNYTAWETDPPDPFTSLSVSPSSLSPSMSETGAVPTPDTLTISNDGNSGEFGGTVSVATTPQDCQPTTGGNTTWLAVDDGTFSGVTADTSATETISYANATSCEEGSYTATIDVACTSGDTCDDTPQSVSVTLTVNPVGASGALTTTSGRVTCDPAANSGTDTDVTVTSVIDNVTRTFRFEEPGLDCAEYADGSPVIANSGSPVTLKSVTPAMDSGCHDGSGSGCTNGLMKNYTNSNMNLNQALTDEGAAVGTFNASESIGALPQTLQPDDMIVAASQVFASCSSTEPCFEMLTLLHVRGSLAADSLNTLRPSMFYPTRPAQDYLLEDLNLALVPSITEALPAGAIPFADYADRFGTPNFPLINNFNHRAVAPRTNTFMDSYHANRSYDTAGAALRYAYSDFDPENNETHLRALIGLVQIGLDAFGFYQNGGGWRDHSQGVLLPMAIVGLLLGEPTIRAEVGVSHSEHEHTWFNLSNRADSGNGKHLWGQLSQFRPADENYFFGARDNNSCCQNAIDPFGYIDGVQQKATSFTGSIPALAVAAHLWGVDTDFPDSVIDVGLRWADTGWWLLPDPCAEPVGTEGVDYGDAGTGAGGNSVSPPGTWMDCITRAEAPSDPTNMRGAWNNQADNLQHQAGSTGTSHQCSGADNIPYSGGNDFCTDHDIWTDAAVSNLVTCAPAGTCAGQ